MPGNETRLKRSNTLFRNSEIFLLSSYSFRDLSTNNSNYSLDSSTDIKTQYLSFKKKFLIKDHQETYYHRRLNFLRRSHHLRKYSNNKYGKYHSLSKEEQYQLYENFLVKSKDVTLIWDEIRRLPSLSKSSLDKTNQFQLSSSQSNLSTSSLSFSLPQRNVGFTNSFSMAGRRNSYLGDDASFHESRKPKLEIITKPFYDSKSPDNSINHKIPRISNLSQQSVLAPTKNSLNNSQFDNLFHPMPYSNLDIIRQAQHPDRIILGGRTIINKYLNEIFQSITPNDWILPYIVCILLLFNAEDKKLKDSSLLFQASSNDINVRTTSSNSAALQFDLTHNEKNSGNCSDKDNHSNNNLKINVNVNPNDNNDNNDGNNNNGNNNNNNNYYDLNILSSINSNSTDPFSPNTTNPTDSTKSHSLKRLISRQSSNSMSLMDQTSDSTQSVLTFQTLNSIDDTTKSLFRLNSTNEESKNNNKDNNNNDDNNNLNLKKSGNSIVLEENIQKPPSKSKLTEISIPIFPISSYFSSYRYLSTVYLAQSSHGPYQPIFWIKKHLFLIDGFVFQCDLDEKYLIPTGFLYLEEDRVKLIQKQIIVRETTSTNKIVTNTYIKIQFSKSPACNPLENSSDAGFSTILFVTEKGINTETEKLYQILVDASRLSVYDVYEFNKKNLLGTGRYAEIFDCPSHLSLSPVLSISASNNSTNKLNDDTTSRDSSSRSRDMNTSTDNNNHNSRIAIKLIKKKDFAISVSKLEERPCTLLREIVLLWRANYKAVYENDDQKIETGSNDRPLMKIYGILETRDHIVIEMERMEKLTLFNIASELSKFTEKQTRHIAIQLVQCVYHLNHYDIAHRDIKLSNICFPYLDKNSKNNSLSKYFQLKNKLFHKNQLKKIKFNIKLIDFGMSGFVQEDGLLRGRCGTIGCVAPEILNKTSQEGYCLACDMFSIGIVLYTLYTGYEPFYGDTFEELALSNKVGYIETGGSDWTSLSPDGQDFILSCLNLNPAKRLTPYQAFHHPWIVSYYGHDCYDQYPPISIKKKKLENLKNKRGTTCNIS